jgi:thymidine phosphorylase
VEPHAGIEMHVKLGARIAPGQPLVTMFAADAEKLVEPENLLREALMITDEPGIVPPLVYEYVTAENANNFS